MTVHPPTPALRQKTPPSAPVARRAPQSAPDPPGFGSLSHDPFQLTVYGGELLRRRLMLAPVVVVWQYRIADPARFKGWLATREILLSQTRLEMDSDVAGVRYGGTYLRADGDEGNGRSCRTLWGYASEAAMTAMHSLCSGQRTDTTLVQNDLSDFVAGLKQFVAEAGDHHFSQELLVAAECAAP